MNVSRSKGKAAWEDKRDSEGPSRGQLIRWLLACLTALVAAAFYLHGVQAQTICRDVVDSGQVVNLCGPPGLNDLVPFALVILVLLAPDFTELAIPGLLSLKRAVTRQESRQDQVEMKLAQVEQRVDNRISVTVLNAAEQDVVTKAKLFQQKEEDEEPPGGEAPPIEPPEQPSGGGTEETREAPGPDQEASEEKSGEPEAVEKDEGSSEAPGLITSKDDARASLTLQLAWLTKNLTQYETISRLREVDPTERMAALTEKQQKAVDRWYTVFKEEIDVVREFRNALMHNPYAVDLDELKEAVRIGRRLMRILLNGIGASTEPLDSFPEP
jgi:hypothetical protein